MRAGIKRFCALWKESTTTSYKRCRNILSPYRVSSNTKMGSFCFMTVVVLLLIELLHLHQFKQDKLAPRWYFLSSAQRYSTSCAIFIRNKMVESSRASLLSCPIKLKLITNIFTAKMFRIILYGKTLLYSGLSWIFW